MVGRSSLAHALVAALCCLELLARGGVLHLAPRGFLHIHGRRRPRPEPLVLPKQMRIERLFASAEFIQDLLLREPVAAGGFGHVGRRCLRGLAGRVGDVSVLGVCRC